MSDKSQELKLDEIIDESKSVEEHGFKSVGALKASLMYKQYHTLTHKIFIFIGGFLAGFAYMLDSNLRSTFTGYATGSFGQHSLLSTINVVTTIIGVAGQVLFARLSDTFGRVEMYIVSIVLYVVGTIVQSQATDVARYATGAVIYELGYVGIVLLLMVMMADFSSMRSRLLFMLAPTFGSVILTWTSGNILSAVGPEAHWSWGIGMWAFIFPLANIPFLLCLGHMWLKARKLDEWRELNGTRREIFKRERFNFFKNLYWELDVVGVVLLTVVLGCILAPLTLAGGLQKEWKKAHIIVPIVVGCVLISVFLLWERFYARFPLCPMTYFKNRGIWCPLAISFLVLFINMVASEYLYTLLIVAVNQTTTSAQRIITLWGFPGIIAAEVMIGFGTSFFSYPITVIMQSHLSHDYLASVTSMGLTLYRIGGAVGSSVGGAIWTQTLYGRLQKSLPQSVAEDVYNDPFTWVLSHPWNTLERQLVVEDYRYVERLLTMVALVFTAPLIILACITKEKKLSTGVTEAEEETKSQSEEK
ncbi:Siderophore transporter [Meyerozyma guilliermondii]